MPFVPQQTTVPVRDLGHLAWVLEDVRKSLTFASNVVRRFDRDQQNGSDTVGRRQAEVNTALRLVEQSAGVLEMVGHQHPAKLVRAMGRWMQSFTKASDAVADDATSVLEATSRAVLDYLDARLKGSLSSPVALFAQYRAVVQLAGGDRAHPADLWPWAGRWDDFLLTPHEPAMPTATLARSQLDKSLLSILRHFDADSARQMVGYCRQLACAGSSLPVQNFWWIAAAFFEALCLGELPNDVCVRRTAARIIPAYGLLAEGQTAALSGLVHEMLFYCAFAAPASVDVHAAANLSRVKNVLGLENLASLDYESAPFGKFDLAQLAHLRKLIGIAAEGWSALSGGDVGRASAVVAQFAEMGAAALEINPHNEALVSALIAAVEASMRMAMTPNPGLAIEVATAMLYLEIVHDDFDLTNESLEQHSARLAARLQHVAAGGHPMPIEGWMEALYRRVGDRKMMGTVVGELANSLAEIERAVDYFVRDPSESSGLQLVPVALGHMRGVFSVLGLSQAALAALRMRSTVECLLAPDEVDLEAVKKWTLQLVNSLSAMGFLIDMLRYQPAMARELFEYDENACEFRLTMEREQGGALAERFSQVQAFGLHEALLSGQHLPLDEAQRVAAVPALSAVSPLASGNPVFVHENVADAEMQDIFLSEACGVIDAGAASIIGLGLARSNMPALVGLRRAFHTLKGSARMVGFRDFGEAAWALEQLLNSWIESKRPASDRLLALCEDTIKAMKTWIESISLDRSQPFQAEDFRRSADALRLEDLGTGLAPLQSLGMELPDTPPQEEQSIALPIAAEPESSPAMERLSLYTGTAHEAHGEKNSSVSSITIGSLQLRLDFFEVFINEAGPWATQLQTEIENWPTPVSQEALQKAAALAHALHGSAAAVGFVDLAALAQTLERIFEHLLLHALAVTDEKFVLCEAVHDINRLLDAFANGELVHSSIKTVEALEHLLNAGNAKPVLAERSDLPPISTPLPTVSADECESEVPFAVGSSTEVTKNNASSSVTGPVAETFETRDVLDEDLWLVFCEEGAELLQDLSVHLNQWISQPQEVQFRAQVLRTLHTLKGSARLTGAMRLGELAHRMESAVDHAMGEPLSNDAFFVELLQYLEQLKTMFGELAPGNDTQTSEWEVRLPTVVSYGNDQAFTNVHTSLSFTQPRNATGSSIRVRAQVLDRLIDHAGEVMAGRTRMDQRIGQMNSSLSELGRSLHRLRHQLRDLEFQTELQMRSRHSQTPEGSPLFDPLELDRFTALQEVSRMMAESVVDVDALHKGLQHEAQGAQEDLLGQGRRAKELTHGLLRMRLVEFESIAERLYGVVRQAAKETGKQVRLDIEGGSIEVDRGVLDRMTSSFEHMLRNAVVHGIEPPEVRIAAGKAETGAICISVVQDGSDVSVRFGDDGAGLQLEKIRARAVEAKLLEAHQPLSYEQASQLLFVPGFSTADSVTELAGRGIGMDVVLSDVSAIGGRIETSSQVGGGTSFQVIFPLTTAVTQIVLLRMDTMTIGVPVNLLETVLRIPQDQINHAYTTGVLQQGSGQAMPFAWAGAIVGVSKRAQRENSGTRQQAVAVIRSAGQRVALHVDEVLGNREVVVKNLGVQLSQLPGLVGISVLASGAVVLIYNPVALMNVYGESIRDAHATINSVQTTFSSGLRSESAADGAMAKNAPLVLVVDDSITVRRVTQRLLNRAGFRVALSSDGVQALELLRDERPAVVLSDIEMPRMDGMELTRQIRSDAKLSDLPIIIITSRIAQKHRDHAAALGANHYLGKPYAEAELLELVRSYCTAAELV